MVSKNELKFIKSLKVKKYRSREGRFLVEGAKNVLELLKSDYKVDIILSTKEFSDDNKENFGANRWEEVSIKVLEETGTFKSNTTCLAVAFTKDFELNSIDITKTTFVLDGINDPGNLGTIIRTLDWFGYDQLICSRDVADIHNPKVVSSTMGSFFRCKFVYTDLNDFLSKVSLPVYAADMNGKNLFKQKIQEPCVFIMGNEANGISKEISNSIDYHVTIPKLGEAESLNVAIATGIIAAHLRMS
jgi:TrmH family RNA methyltransferase